MYVAYRPVGGAEDETPEAQEFVFIPGKCSNFDAESIESETGWTWDEFLMYLQKGSIKARRALLWILLRRVHRSIRFKDVRFTPAEVTVEYDAAELEETRRSVEDAPEQPGVDKQPLLDYLAGEIEKARPAPDGSGKAPELLGADSTGLPSHKSALVPSSNAS